MTEYICSRPSNLGSSEILDGISESGTLSEEARKSVQAILRRTFKPEFLNRIDDTVIFTPLSRDQVRSIVNLLLNHLRERLAFGQECLQPILDQRQFRRLVLARGVQIGGDVELLYLGRDFRRCNPAVVELAGRADQLALSVVPDVHQLRHGIRRGNGLDVIDGCAHRDLSQPKRLFDGELHHVDGDDRELSA